MRHAARSALPRTIGGSIEVSLLLKRLDNPSEVGRSTSVTGRPESERLVTLDKLRNQLSFEMLLFARFTVKAKVGLKQNFDEAHDLKVR